MRCEKARKTASPGGAEAPGIRRHLEECPSCRAWLDNVRSIEEIHRSLPSFEAPGRMTGEIMAAVREVEQERGGGLWRLIVPAAAAVFVAIGVYAGSYISDSMLASHEPHYTEMTGLEYLQPYPPESVGEALDLAARGEEDE